MGNKVITYLVAAVVVGAAVFVALQALLPRIMNVFGQASSALAHTP
jgi:hypothetical protein